ncbi:MAG: FxsA family protein [Solirubrobacterales bacterium]|nr:FxsA family protein [Solirubrobacterales bacterium]
MLVLALICWLVVEIFVAILVAHVIGALLTVLLLLAGLPLGAWAIRSEGRLAWRRLSDSLAAGRPPGYPVLNGALVVAGGALVMIPGFVTDVLGVCLLLPPTRRLARGLLVAHLQSRLLRRATESRRARADVDSTATDIAPTRLPR